MSPLSLSADAVEFAVIDTETVGASGPPVEVAVVVVTADGELIEEWTTLVNPDEPVGWAATKLHGLRQDHLTEAPRFADIIGDLDELLHQRVLVGHNVRFDLDVLRGAYQREGFGRSWSGICTQRAGFRRSLDIECASRGHVPSGAWHQALTDARATAFLLGGLLQRDRDGLETLGDILARLSAEDCRPFTVVPPSRQPSRRILTRMQRAGAVEDGLTLVSGLVGAMPPVDRAPEPNEYRRELRAALADRMISGDEVRALVAAAAAGGLSTDDLAAEHRGFFADIAAVAAADHSISAAEQADLTCVADLLGIDEATANGILRSALHEVSAEHGAEPIPEGTRVAVTGAVKCTVGGVAISRADLKRIIEENGSTMKSTVSARNTDLVVLCDPASVSKKAEDARRLGKPVMGITEFLVRLGVRVD